MASIALKVDVDTWLGTRDGVPRLLETLGRLDVPATFLFSLGPDHTGRAIRRVLRPGFLSKVRRTSVVSHYGIRTLLYGTLLPGPRIARRCGDLMREVARRGFEVGVHAYDHVAWQDGAEGASEAWTRRQMQRACEAFTDVFHEPPRIHGAAGWQVNAFVPALERELGFHFASDVRGTSPFLPAHARPSAPLEARTAAPAVPQLPTTLPTLDELIGTESLGSRDPVDELLERTRLEPARDEVFTLHAEIEGGAYLASFERLLRGWREQGRRLEALGGQFARLDPTRLPTLPIQKGRAPGRSGTLATQGLAA